MTQKKTEAVTIRFTPKFNEQLEEAAEEAGRTKVDYIRTALRKSVGVQSELGAVDEEEVLRRLDEIEATIENQEHGTFRRLFGKTIG